MKRGLKRTLLQPGSAEVCVGLVGLGNIGRLHARHLLEGLIPRARLVAVADIEPTALQPFAELACFNDPLALIRSGVVDAVIIATPHYQHTPLGIAALRAGLHVMMEKPISVDRLDCERLIAAHTDKRQMFAAMFNQRTDPRYQRLRTMVQGGELGKIQRVAWTVTDWFRPQAYYTSSKWRATWSGEGGGVLLNQCPHNLDLLYWIFGQPARIRAFCKFGRHHRIETEDEVTAYLEYPDGAHCTFVTSTGEAPGTNRLEVAGDNGRVIIEPGSFRYTRNTIPASHFSSTSQEYYSAPPCENVPITIEGTGGQHREVLENFVRAILDGTPLIAPAREGINSVEMANAMLLSTWTNSAIELPLSAQRYRRILRQKIAASAIRTPQPAGQNVTKVTFEPASPA